LYITGEESCKIKLYYYDTLIPILYIIFKNSDRDVAIVCRRQCVMLSRIYLKKKYFHPISYNSSKINCRSSQKIIVYYCTYMQLSQHPQNIHAHPQRPQNVFTRDIFTVKYYIIILRIFRFSSVPCTQNSQRHFARAHTI